jgi:hypothetical protein
MDWSDAGNSGDRGLSNDWIYRSRTSRPSVRGPEAGAAERDRERAKRKRALFIEWLRISADLGEVAVKYIQHGG